MRPPRPSADPAPEVPTVVAAGIFKAKVTAYLRHVERTGSTIVITNRGRPVATLTSAVRRPGNTFVGAGRGAIRAPKGVPSLVASPLWNAISIAAPTTPEQLAGPGPRLLTDGQEQERPTTVSQLSSLNNADR
jgi:prevent-host-death family protein